MPHLSAENVDRMVRASAGKSTREIAEMLRSVAPLPVYEPGIRKQPERARTEESAPAPATTATATATAEAVPAGAGEIALPGVLERPTQYVPAVPRRTSNVLEAATPETYNFRFSADKAFRDKLERLAEVLGVRNPVAHMGELLERAVDCLLERKDPERRRARRLEREERCSAHLAPDVEATTNPAATSPEVPPPAPGEAAPAREPEASEPPAVAEVPTEPSPRVGSRRPSAADWDDALERAGYQCEFRGRDGRRCAARTGLQPDHYPVPWAVSRTSDPDGIRVHCPAHNSLTAREYFGEAFIHAKVAEARAKRHEARGEAGGRARKTERRSTGGG